MDPATTSLVDSIIALAAKASEGAALRMGEDAWERATRVFGMLKTIMHLDAEPETPDLREQVIKALEARPEVAPEVRKELVRYEVLATQTVVRPINYGKER